MLSLITRKTYSPFLIGTVGVATAAIVGLASRVPAVEPEKVANPAAGSARPGAGRDALAPLVEIQHEDYAKARGGYQSRLLRHGPAPQPWTPAKPPAGAAEVHYSSGALTLKAWISRPASTAEKRPAVLFLHGGFAFDKEDWAISQPFRDAGYVVLTPILRGENGQPGAFSLFYDEVDDVLAAADFLSRQAAVDPSHLYIAGASAGGTLALLAAETSTRFRAAASYSASPDQALLVRHAKIRLPFERDDARALQLRSPLAFAESFKCPARIYYATQDHFVLTSRRTADVARARGLDVEAIPIKGDHGSIVPVAIKRSIPFFQAR